MSFAAPALLLDSRTAPFVTRQRRFFAILSLFAVLFGSCPVRAAETYDLKAAPNPKGAWDVRVVLEARGDLTFKSAASKVRRVPMRVRGELAYQERFLSPTQSGGLRAVRQYSLASAKIDVAKNRMSPRLSDEKRLIVAEVRDRKLQLRSPLGPFRRSELDLVKVQGDTLLLRDLLPADSVGLEQTWSPSKDAWAQVLCLEAVSQAKVIARLRKVEGDIALVDLEGPLSGAVGGVATDIDVRAKLNFDMRRKRVTWLAMTLKEARSIGHADPGVEATSRIRIALQPAATARPELSDQALKGLPLTAPPDAAVLEHRAASGAFRLLHDPRWRLISDRRKLSVFRLVDKGDLVAQCNLSTLAPRPADKPLTLREFQDDIRSALGKNFVRFVESTEYASESGLKALRTVAAGESQGLKIHWIYYHLSDPSGQRLSLVFTLETELVERFGTADQTLVSTIRLLKPQDSQPAAAQP